MNEQELHIRWAEGERTFSADRVVVIGRDPGCEVTLDYVGVSRRHAEVRWSGDGWLFQDLSSSQGSYHDGVGVTAVPIDGTVELVLGQGRDAPRVSLRASAAPGTGVPTTELPTSTSGSSAGRSSSAATLESEDSATDQPVPAAEEAPPGEERARPGGALRPGPAAATVVSGDNLRLECGGRSYEFTPGQQVTIGRDETCDVVTSNPTVSRQHARLSHSSGEWVLSDLNSTAGIFLDGGKISSQPIHGSMAFWLGDPDVGERVVAVGGGQRTLGPMARLDRAGRRGRVPLLVGLVGLVLLALVAGGVTYAMTRDSEANQDTLAKASVKLEGPNHTGSGTIIDASQGLILTNAHVAAPDAPGSGVRSATPETSLPATPRQLVVLVAPGSGKAAEPRFFAEPVAVDAYLDLAVMKITKTAAGALVEPGDLAGLTSVRLGDSGRIRPGQRITVVGYPGVAASKAGTVTTGVVSGFEQDNRLASNRAYVNTDAEINSGNSGGLAADSDGKMIGVPSAALSRSGLTPEEPVPGKIGLVRPLALATPLIAAARTGQTYKSPHITPLVGAEAFSKFRYGAAVDGIALTCTRVDRMPAGAISVAFDYSGFAEGEHQDFMVRLQPESTTGTQPARAMQVKNLWPFRWQLAGCGTVTFTAVQDGAYTLEFFAGPNYKQLARLTVRVGNAIAPGAPGTGSAAPGTG